MSSITLQTHVGGDGILKLTVPVGLPNTDVEVTVIVQPLPLEGQSGLTEWPTQFFEQTYGMFEEEPLLREDQGEYEVRDPRVCSGARAEDRGLGNLNRRD